MNDPIVGLPDDLVRSGETVSSLAVSWELLPESLTNEFRALAMNGLGLTIGVTDTGVDAKHPALDGCNIIAAKDFTNSRTGPEDHNGHGTFVLAQIFRLLPLAKFVVGKVLGDTGSGSSSGIVDGAEFCANQGCEAINASLGSSQRYDPMGGFLKAFSAVGLYFAASGNSGGSMGWPSLWGIGFGVIPTGAYDRNKRRANFSSFGEPLLALGAGVGIIGPKAQTKDDTEMSGSSMGTPDNCASHMGYVNGLRSVGGGDITAPEARMKMVEAIAEDIEQEGRDQKTGFGLVTREMVVKQLKKVQP